MSKKKTELRVSIFFKTEKNYKIQNKNIKSNKNGEKSILELKGELNPLSRHFK